MYDDILKQSSLLRGCNLNSHFLLLFCSACTRITMATFACLFKELQRRMPAGIRFQLRMRLGLCLALPGWMFTVSDSSSCDLINPPKSNSSLSFSLFTEWFTLVSLSFVYSFSSIVTIHIKTTNALSKYISLSFRYLNQNKHACFLVLLSILNIAN